MLKTLELIANMNTPSNSPIAIALKPSSFAPADNPAQAMADVIKTYCKLDHISKKHVFIDAESPKEHEFEQDNFSALVKLMCTDDIPGKSNVVMYRTIQAYRRDAMLGICQALATAECVSRNHGLTTGVKLVRGAYHSPAHADVLFQSINDTHESYNTCLQHLLEHNSQVPSLHICIATHNSNSVERALKYAQSHIKNKKVLSFAQLLGMGDDLSHRTQAAGFTTFKYVPFGQFSEMMPYLVRRLFENYAILGHITRT